MKRASIGVNSSFKFRLEGLETFYLKYGEDIVLVRVLSKHSLLTFNMILKSFELVYGLKVNIYKSYVFWFNVGREFRDLAKDFLNSKSGSLPFKYLGLSEGAKPRKEGTFDPLVKVLST